MFSVKFVKHIEHLFECIFFCLFLICYKSGNSELDSILLNTILEFSVTLIFNILLQVSTLVLMFWIINDLLELRDPTYDTLGCKLVDCLNTNLYQPLCCSVWYHLKRVPQLVYVCFRIERFWLQSLLCIRHGFRIQPCYETPGNLLVKLSDHYQIHETLPWSMTQNWTRGWGGE